MVAEILEACSRIREQHPEPTLIAFEVGTEAFEGLKTVSIAQAQKHGFQSVPVRLCSHLRPDIVVPVLRGDDGEETWGEPIHWRSA